MAGDGTWFVLCMGSSYTYFPLIMQLLELDDLLEDEKYSSLEIMNSTGTNVDAIKKMEEAFAKYDFAHWQKIFDENSIAYHRLYYFEDILEDVEAYANDILRKLPYETFGEKALATSPIRLESVGDPVLYRSRPIGYDTKIVMKEYGYSDGEIETLLRENAVKAYEGPELQGCVLEASYGPDSVV